MTREIFTTIYKNFMTKNPKDETLLFYEGRNINLYQLHYEVINAGGVNRVIQNDLWPVIGARLGFVNIPASDTEPAKAGPAFAHRLASIYKEFLLDFDKQYYLSMVKKHVASQRQLAENGLPVQQRNGVPSQPGAQNANPIRQLTDIQDSRLMSEIVSYSILPTEELQRRNVPPNIIQLVDQNRQQLQQSFERQRAFRAQLAKNTQGAQNGMGVPQLQRNPSVPMPGVPPTVGMLQQNGMGMMALAEPLLPSDSEIANQLEALSLNGGAEAKGGDQKAKDPRKWFDACLAQIDKSAKAIDEILAPAAALAT
ncbi:hypothetical protein NUW54_g92 [Trametes sanguinea]|uniref:Uncharacterized protein n=1 Tax=Trametes sanguinea TaxID=158606 RepID=A0ACC1QAE5_9APHY|nr:hypothetical protein NUW54_g92 [Trametes sanguinea]